MRTKKLGIINLWKNSSGALLFIISSVLIAMMTICLMVNSGIAQKLAEHAEGVYIVTAVWFAIVAFCSCKPLRGDMGRVKLVSTSGKHTAKKEG